MIRKKGSQWCVYSEDGSRTFGCYSSRAAAVKRLGQVEYFKRHTLGIDDKVAISPARISAFAEAHVARLGRGGPAV
jgi:hypothetical protein